MADSITIANRLFPKFIDSTSEGRKIGYEHTYIDISQGKENDHLEYIVNWKKDIDTKLIQNKILPSGKWLDITLEEPLSRFGKKDGQDLAGAWDVIVKAQEDKTGQAQQIRDWSYQVILSDAELEKQGKEVQMRSEDKTVSMSKNTQSELNKKSAVILGVKKLTLKKREGQTVGVKQADDFHYYYGKMDSTEKSGTMTVTKGKGKNAVKEEVEFDVDPAIQSWKENWLFREPRTTEFKTSPKLLWKVLMDLKKGKSYPEERADYYTKSTLPILDLFLRRKGKQAHLTNPEKVAEIKKDLVKLRKDKIKEGREDEKPTAWYNSAKAVRGFLQIGAGFGVGDQEPTSPLAQSVKAWTGNWNLVKIEPEKIDDLFDCINYKSKGKSFWVEVPEPTKYTFNIQPEYNENKEPIFDTPNQQKELNAQKSEFMSKFNKDQKILAAQTSFKQLPNDKYSNNSQIPEDIFNTVKNLKLSNMKKTKDKDYELFYLTKTVDFDKKTRWETIPADWKNAELLVRICMEFGCRKNEALTISAFPAITKAKQVGTKGFTQTGDVKTGIDKMEAASKLQKNIQLEATIATWKTANLGDLGKLTVQQVINQDNARHIWQRCEEVREKYDFKRNSKQSHTLIGDDNFYIPISQIQDHPNSYTFNDEQTKNLSRLNWCLRHCYDKIGKDWNDTTQGAYFFDKPIHVLRHVMAQQFSYQTNQDWDWIAQRGHWKTIGVLKDSYAGLDQTINLVKNLHYGQLDFTQQAIEITDAEKQMFTSPEYQILKKSEFISKLNDASFRKNQPAEAYYIYQDMKHLDPDWQKHFGEVIKNWAADFKHNEKAVADYNTKYASKDKKIPAVVYVEKPVEIIEEVETEIEL